ncbi:hypothetical protein J2W39_006320 [Variovorax paradoxus]|uniref:O-antigen polymerase n=1 Tax=Variovorax paradoxus TaxID=34073 RepID=A0AAW8ETC1_VARPD|nr:hypothetical protein [Variovorax paradoxus]MDP9975036.1 hypothetical protein [Variovorax paradoxus]
MQAIKFAVPRLRYKSILLWISFATAFVSGLYIETPVGVLFFSYFVMAATYISMIVFNRSFGVAKEFIFLFLVLLIASLISVLLTYDSYGLLVERVIFASAKAALLMFFVVYYHSAYRLAGKSVTAVFEKYLQVATFFAWLGIAQQLFFVVARVDIFSLFTHGAKDYGAYLGVAGMSVEPAFYACALLPAAAYHTSGFVRNFKISFGGAATILALIFSTSSLGYLGLFAAVAISFFTGLNPKKLWILAFTVPFALFGAYKLVDTEFFQLRLNDTISMIENTDLTVDDGINISTYSAVVNASIAQRSVSDNFGVGAGFGMYNVVFDKYIDQYDIPAYRDDLPGRGSATSLLSRLTAELGVGAWMFLSLFFFWIWRAIRAEIYPAIGIACLSTLIIILLRMGEYYANGVVFVFLLIYLMNKEFRLFRRNKKISLV